MNTITLIIEGGDRSGFVDSVNNEFPDTLHEGVPLINESDPDSASPVGHFWDVTGGKDKTDRIREIAEKYSVDVYSRPDKFRRSSDIIDHKSFRRKPLVRVSDDSIR